MKTPPPTYPGKGPIGPMLDVSVESEAFLKTFAEYTMRVNLLPSDALERKAWRLRMSLVRQFKAIRLGKGQAKREMKARGGRLKIRKSIREKYKKGTFLGGLYNKKSRARISVQKKIKKTGQMKTIQRFAWADAVAKELAARQRSRALLAASWVNRGHTYKEKDVPKTGLNAGTFNSRLLSNKESNSVQISQAGPNATIMLRNFIQNVADTDQKKGIIARTLRFEADDMRQYLARKAARAAAAMNKGGNP